MRRWLGLGVTATSLLLLGALVVRLYPTELRDERVEEVPAEDVTTSAARAASRQLPINVATSPAPLPAPPDVRATSSGEPLDAGAGEMALEPSWKERWRRVELDTHNGKSLGSPGIRKAFTRALQRESFAELKECVRNVPGFRMLTATLYVEETSAGFTIHGAEVPRDAGLDVYARRCLELGFEKHLMIPPDAGTLTPGKLYKLEFPIAVHPSEAPEGG